MSKILYRCPGRHPCPRGTFDYEKFQGDRVNEALKSGWFRTLSEAIAGKSDPVKIDDPVVNELETLGDDKPPTRAELEQKAKELKLSHKKNISDADLLKLINKALEG